MHRFIRMSGRVRHLEMAVTLAFRETSEWTLLSLLRFTDTRVATVSCFVGQRVEKGCRSDGTHLDELCAGPQDTDTEALFVITTYARAARHPFCCTWLLVVAAS